MALQVRPITDDDFEAWNNVMQVAFHNSRPAADVAAFRREAFPPDWARTLAAVDGAQIVGTIESFPAELSLPGEVTVASDAVSAVSVLPTHRRRGALSSMIVADLRTQRERGEVASILIPSEYPIYGRFGFGPATVRVEFTIDTFAARFTRAAAGHITYVEPAQLRTLAPPLFDRFRSGWPGQIDRRPIVWDVHLGLRETPWQRPDSVLRCATYTSDTGELEGYLTYRTEENRLQRGFSNRLEVLDLITLSSEAYLALWRFVSEIDLVSEVRAGRRYPEEPLYWLVENPRAALQETRRTDFLWVRPLDTARFLASRRYALEGQVVLDITDPLGLCGGRYVLEGGPSGATCRHTQKSADLSLGMTALGAISLGGRSLVPMAEAGLIQEHTPGALARADQLFRWPVTPWCSTGF